MWVDHAQRAIARMLDRKGFRSRFAKTAAGRLHYFDLKGSGPRGTVVIQHGIASSGAAFARLAGSLAKAFGRVVVPDAPGHGLSDAPADGLTPDRFYEGVVHILDEVVPEPFVLVGNSLGGATALRFASTAPKRLRATVVCSPGGAASTDAEFRALVTGFRAETHREAILFARRLYHVPPWHLPVSAAFIGALLNRPPVREFFMAASSKDFLEPVTLQGIAGPLLFIWGKGERLLPTSHRDFFVEHLPKHTVFEFPERYGHVPQVEHPRDLAERIVRFVSVEFK
jgi:pimeloyl-ACP methyl ester carboxylesterase